MGHTLWIVLLALFVVVMVMHALVLANAAGTAVGPKATAILAFISLLVLGVVVFLTGFGVIVAR
jgi:hypothetical protein